MIKYYLKDNKSIAFFSTKATHKFWDRHWQTDKLSINIRSFKTDGIIVPEVKKYLPKNSIVLEGGCGLGQLVYSLQHSGYNTIGLDYAKNTIYMIKAVVPEIDLIIGDVLKLPIKDNKIDGYISGGVIEHFWQGYEKVISEMARVIKVGGYLFITFPYLSFIRKIKIYLRLFSISTKYELEGNSDKFYQFALDKQKVIDDFRKAGFIHVKNKNYNGLKGFKDEVRIFNRFLQNIYDGKYLKMLRFILNIIFKPFASHTTLLVLKKIS